MEGSLKGKPTFLFKEHLLQIKIYEPGKPVEEVQRELSLKRIYKLASNENPFGPSPLAVNEMKKMLSRVFRYPDGKCTILREKLSQILRVGEKNIIFANGSNEIIELFTRAFLREGEKVIIPHPTFSVYYNSVIAERGEMVLVPLTRDYQFDVEGIISAIDEKVRAVFISNPNNPTGCYLNIESLNRIIEKLPEGAILFLDEAYFEYATAPDFPDGVEYVRKGANVLVTRTFSKVYGLAGLRIGYGIGREDIIEGLERLRQPFNVNFLAQVAAVKALEDKKHIEKTLRNNEREKKRMCETLKAMGVKVYPSQANFLLIDASIPGKELFRRLLLKGVIVRFLGEPLEKCVRVTIGMPEENKYFLKALKEVLKETRSCNFK